MTIHNVASLAGAAHLSKLTPALCLNGFECFTLWSFEFEIFPPEAFVALKLIDEPETQDETETQSEGGSGKFVVVAHAKYLLKTLRAL